MDKVMVAGEDFRQLITGRSQTLLGLASYLSQQKAPRDVLMRPLLGELLSQSIQIEELLDAYDARNNCTWCQFRSLTAAIKLFTDVSYELLHIQHALPAYRLLPIEQDFVKATDQALVFTGDVLLRAASRMLTQAHQLGLPVPVNSHWEESYSEHLPAGRLPHNCNSRRTETVSETVTLLSTTFLNLAAESEQLCAAARVRPEEYASYVSNSVSEERLRSLELRFHNLQSMYDTYVSGTELENLDEDLPVLRGHISVVYHLLKTATALAHYYERHLKKPICDLQARQAPLVNSDMLLAILVEYSVTYAGCYIGCAERLCRTMLRRYAEIGRIEVPAPHYRGFHVRPSTLISRLVLHYGSDVRMELDGEQYDAGSPLEMFRANEKMNAGKRRWMAEEIVRLGLVPQQACNGDISTIVRNVVLTLAEQSRLILYEQPLQLNQELTQREGTLLEQVIDEMAQLLAIGKIDIDADLKVTFVGDKRVLADIELLADSGYGEDKFGNNITLPEKLIYLR